MQTPTNLNQALQAFQKQLEKSAHEMQAKDLAFKNIETQTQQLKNEIDQAQREIEVKRRKWEECERLLPKLRADADRAHMEHRRVMAQVDTEKRNLAEAERRSKGGHVPM